MLKTEVELECVKHGSVRAYKGRNFKIMHFNMRSCDLLTIALLMRYHKPIFMKFLKLALLGAICPNKGSFGPENADFQKMEKTSLDIATIYHKNPKVKVSDVLTGFCCAPKFCDGHTDRQTDTHCEFLTQLKLRTENFFFHFFLMCKDCSQLTIGRNLHLLLFNIKLILKITFFEMFMVASVEIWDRHNILLLIFSNEVTSVPQKIIRKPILEAKFGGNLK